MDIMQILNIIQTQYPDAMPILKQPGVFQVYVDYLNSNDPNRPAGVEPWTKAELEAHLRATPYYQNTPQAGRDWDILRATDPATANTKLEQTKRTIDDLSSQLGVQLNTNGGMSSPGFAFLVDAMKYGWDENEIRYRLLASVNKTAGGGMLATQAAQIKSMANDYGVPLSDKAVMNWATKVSQGAMDMNGVQGYLIEQAKSLFPALAPALDKGITVKDYAAPYLQLAQQELDINPSDVNLTDQKWMAALNQVDPKTGQRVSMSLDSWLSKLRTDPAYGYDTTAKGRQDATTLAAQLQQKLGAAA